MVPINEATADGDLRQVSAEVSGAGRGGGQGTSPHSQPSTGPSELHARRERGPVMEVDTGRELAAELAAPTPVATGSMPSEYQLKEGRAGQRMAYGEAPSEGRAVLAPLSVPRDLDGVAADKGSLPEQTADRWRPGHGRPPSPRLAEPIDTHNSYLPLASLSDSHLGSAEVDEERREDVRVQRGDVTLGPSSVDAYQRECPGASRGSHCGGSRSRARRRRRALGPLEAHVRFLQFVFRRTREKRPGCWRKGGLRGLFPLRRGREICACGLGLNLAKDRAFQAQRERARAVLAWYRQYVVMLRGRLSGRTPTSLELFCGGGGKSEGVRRAGGASHGVDLRDQPSFRRRFGDQCFSMTDATSAVEMRRRAKKMGIVCVGASPPCKEKSSARMRGKPQDPDLLPETRVVLEELGLPWALENVMGNKRSMSSRATILRGSMFGLRVDRPRCFECSFDLHVDEALRAGGQELRASCCLGQRRRWRRLDEFGRPEISYCCEGNIFAVQGDKPWRCSLAECSAAMGVDDDHMPYLELAQAIPPDYGELVFSQTCMHICASQFGAPLITYDEAVLHPTRSRETLAAWLAGAGSASGSGAVSLGEARGRATKAVEGVWSLTALPPPAYAPPAGGDCDTPLASSEALVQEAEFRELFYSPWGGFDQQLVGGLDSHLLDDVKNVTKVSEESGDVWFGHNTLVKVGRDRLRRMLPLLGDVARAPSGRRVSVITDDRRSIRVLRSAGFEVVRHVTRGKPTYASESFPASAWRAVTMLATGRPLDPGIGQKVDYDEADRHMDPRDLTKDPGEAVAKAARSYMPIDIDASRWDDVHMSFIAGDGQRCRAEMTRMS